MSFVPVYVDSSALLKLVFAEPESAPLRRVLLRWHDWITSQLSVVECHRAIRRAGGRPTDHARMDRAFDACAILHVDEPVVRLARTIGPRELRSLDAIHLASALSIGDNPDAFVTYDERLAEAARSVGLTVLQPGA